MNHEHNTHFWNPHTLLHCVDSDILGITIALLAFTVSLWYVIIAIQWIRAAKQAFGNNKFMWTLLAMIFITCSIAGYAQTTIAVWFPEYAIIIRLVALIILNIICPLFTTLAVKREFTAIATKYKIGEKILAATHICKLSDEQLVIMIRQLTDTISN